MKLDPLDKIVSQCIKLKVGAVYQVDDNGRTYLFGNCEYCGEWRMLECSHLHSRVRMTTRYLEDNVAALCGGCHKYLGEHPPAHTEWFKKRLGSDKFEKLNILANMTIKEHPIDKEELMESYKEKLKLMEGE